MGDVGVVRRSVALAGATGLFLLVVASFVWSGGSDDAGGTEEDDETTTTADGGGSGEDDSVPPAAPVGGPCVEIDMAVSTEKATLLGDLAGEYSRDHRLPDGRCVDVSVYRVTSGLAQQALADGWETAGLGVPEPQVWTPTSSIWMTRLEWEWAERGRSERLTDLGSLARSPLTIGMRKPMAEALGWPDEALGWQDVLGLIDAPGGWASVGHPEWGEFTMGKDNPLRSTSGMAASVAAYYAGSGSTGELLVSDVQDPRTREFVAGVELGVVHYADEALKFLTRLAEAEAAASEGDPPYVSAILMQEQLVFLYNTGNPAGESEGGARPRVPLVAISPSDGTLMMDHPFIVLPGASDDQQLAAAGFHQFIGESAQQQRLQEAGFRDASGVAGPDLVEAIDLPTSAEPPTVALPSAEVVDRILDDWSDLRKKVRVLIVYDVSGSMKELVNAPLPETRNDVARDALLRLPDLLTDEDELGLWLFSDEGGTGTGLPYDERVAIASLDTVGRQRIAANIGQIFPGNGNTALFRTIRAATDTLRLNSDRTHIDTILVISDGQNDDLDTDLQGLLTELAGDGTPPIRVFGIALDEDSDLDTLEAIAEVTNAKAYDARDPTVLDAAILDIISNF